MSARGLDAWVEKNTTDDEKAGIAYLNAPQPYLRPHPTNRTVLDDVAVFVSRFVAFGSGHQLNAVVLWIVHTYAMPAADTTARLAVQSAEKQSGKTRLLEVLELLVLQPLSVANISPAAMFRVVAQGPRTLLIDEVDAVFSPKSNGSAEDLRALLNAGYRRGATVARVVGEGKRMDVKEFPVFAPVALAGIGTLPDTVQDRSIVVRLKRRARDEEVSKLRRRLVEPEAKMLRDKLLAWTGTRLDVLGAAIPVVPDELPDRAADCWEPLLAIADEVGGRWPEKARSAAVALCGPQSADESLNVTLLTDIRRVLPAEPHVFSATLCERLNGIEEAPWSGWNDEQGIKPRDLARRLKTFGIESKQVRVGDQSRKGYEISTFADAFTRYLSETCETSETDEVRAVSEGFPVSLVEANETSETLLTCDVSNVSPVSLPEESGPFNVTDEEMF